MNSQIGKIIFAAALGFVSGAAIAAFISYKFMYETVEEMGMEHYNEEINKFKAKYDTKTNETDDINGGTDMHYPTEDDEEVDSDSCGHHVEAADLDNYKQKQAIKNNYSTAFKHVAAEPVTKERVSLDRTAKPMLMSDYDSLVAVVPRGEQDVYEWTFYVNFKGGIVVDIQTEMVMNYNLLFGMNAKELHNMFGNSDTIYIYLPGDNIGVILGIDPEVSPELLELQIPPTMYPGPSEDEDEAEEEDDFTEPDLPYWGD